MQTSKEYIGDIRKPSSAISAKKNRGNNRMGKTIDLFKKIRDIKGIFHAKMGAIKDRNGQYSCLENPMEGGAWQATVHGVAKELDITQ